MKPYVVGVDLATVRSHHYQVISIVHSETEAGTRAWPPLVRSHSPGWIHPGRPPDGGRLLNRRARLALTAILALYGFVLLLHPDRYSFLDSLDLAIHETGHLVFAPFGEFVGFLGGTLMQLVVPSVFGGYFLHRGDRHAATVALWGVAQNLWNISVYVRDARAQELPLVGGGEHDWTYLLDSLDLLHKDVAIGQAVHLLGVVLFVLSLVGGVRTAVEERPED